MMPKFEPKVPGFVLDGRTASEKWMLEQQSIQAQQNEYLAQQNETILTRQAELDTRFRLGEVEAEVKRKEIIASIGLLDERVSVYDRLKENFQGGRLVILCLLSVFCGVIVIPLVSGFFLRLFEKYWR